MKKKKKKKKKSKLNCMLFEVEFDGEYLFGEKNQKLTIYCQIFKKQYFLHNLNISQIPNRFCYANFYEQKLAFLHGSN